MQPEVAVAEAKPGLAAERFDSGKRVPGLVRPAPAALVVPEAGKCVEHAIEVGRDRQSEHFEVVADVDDRGHRRGIDRIDDAAQKARAADAAGEDGNLHEAILSSWSADCVWGPARRCTRSRSLRVSTSSARFGIATATASSPSSRAARWKRSALRGP